MGERRMVETGEAIFDGLGYGQLIYASRYWVLGWISTILEWVPLVVAYHL